MCQILTLEKDSNIQNGFEEDWSMVNICPLQTQTMVEWPRQSFGYKESSAVHSVNLVLDFNFSFSLSAAELEGATCDCWRTGNLRSQWIEWVNLKWSGSHLVVRTIWGEVCESEGSTGPRTLQCGGWRVSERRMDGTRIMGHGTFTHSHWKGASFAPDPKRIGKGNSALSDPA